LAQKQCRQANERRNVRVGCLSRRPLGLCGGRAAGDLPPFAGSPERPPIAVKDMTGTRLDTELQRFSRTKQEFAGQLHDHLRLASC
jgi:hypothetical protein